MSKSLVIVESPAKAKTINKYLGEHYIVAASVGHVKDLPKDGISIDIEAGFVPTYITIKGKEEVIERLKNLAGRCERVFIATDPDREGEAIAHHIAGEIRPQNRNIRRVLFNEITKSGITSAMQRPRDIDESMVQAQEARRVMDRLIGYKVSPFLWRSFAGGPRGLSAGRVQSVALRLVVEREKAINSFIPIEYWSLIGHFHTAKNEEITARLVKFDGIVIKNPTGSAVDIRGQKSGSEGTRPFISTKAQAEELRRRALAEEYHISSIEKKEVKRNAPLPFTTSTLQQEASRRLKMATKRTMTLAQKLYEGVELGKRGPVGLITYMRTDSTRISDEAEQMAEEHIFENYGKEYLPPKRPAPAAAKKGANVQDAHEAIRPTDLKLTPKEARKHLDKDLADLYELIWSRFVASRMAAAIFDQTTVEIAGGPFVFRASGRITRFRGWMQVYSDPAEEAREKRNVKGTKGKEEDDNEESDGKEKEFESVLPAEIRRGDALKLQKIDTRQSFTKPPLRYTESLLVKEMEAKGIGRPSTYASIVSTIQERGYVEQKERKLYATELGMSVCDALVASFPTLFDLKFTAKMEGDLDTIASGDATYLKVMERFYGPFQRALRIAQLPSGNGDTPKLTTRAVGSIEASDRQARRPRAEGKKSDQVCPNCGSPMELRKGQYGPYLACLGFPRCRTIISATEKGKPKAKGGAKAAPSEPTGEVCDKCGSPMVRRKAKGGNEFFGCSNYPECKNTRPIPLDITCPGCNEGQIVERVGGRYSAVFYGCSRYPDCRFTSSTKPVNQPCGKCGSTWLVQAWDQDRGDFLECPKCRVAAG